MSRSSVLLLVMAGLVASASSSAIPMWEFLTRGEKMSHLFNMFVKQVADHCDTSTMPDCQKVLLVYGLTNLAKMEEDSLDKMDPYQRGANHIIWDSMMSGSYKPKPSTDKDHRDYYADATEGGSTSGNQLGSQEEASSTVEKYHEDDRIDGGDASQQVGPGSGRYVIGPMVVRVLPDGSPVPGGITLPKDEDAEEYAAMRAKPLPQFNHHPNHNYNHKSNHGHNYTGH